jgi:thiamine-phosphate pyrophosphorylase
VSLPPVPRLVVVTDRHAAARAGHDLVDVVTAAVDAGTPAVLLRDKDLPGAERLALGRRLQRVVGDAGARLLVASDVALARRLQADGVHLAASDPPCSEARGLIGRSCHDDAEVAAARDEGVDYAFVSPAARTSSKPGYGPAVGPGGLRRLVAVAGAVPVLALGGVTPADVATWRTAGAHGVAVMGGVMTAADPAAAVRALLDALDADVPAAAATSTSPTDHPEAP